MARILALVAFFALVTAFAIGGIAPTGPSAVHADYPAAELSTTILYNCLPDGTVRAELDWTSYNAGQQWLDLSLFNNDFAPGTFQGVGPLAPGQRGVSWDGLTPASWYVARVNTLTPYGWFASQPLAFMTPRDCLAPGAAAAYYPPPTPPNCHNFPANVATGCVWTARDDYLTYVAGEPVVYCYNVSGPMYVRIIGQKPDGSTVTIADRFDLGTGACIGPYQANFPLGLRTISMYAGPGLQLVSQTHFYVR